MQRARRALVSVSDKTGVAEFARGLAELGIRVVSTGGTLRHLRENGVEVTAVSEVTGSPEILGGRVKTLHPRIHGAILADRAKEDHLAELRDQGIEPIDIVAVNLYPFSQTAQREDASELEILEMIDIGGPSMARAAAKNFRSVVVVVDPADYERVLAELRDGDGAVGEATRQRLALKAFRHTRSYDAAITSWLEARHGAGGGATEETGAVPGAVPSRLEIELALEFEPRYGENPHQPAGIYRSLDEDGIFGGFQKLQGKELSWNNMLDADAARKLVSLFDETAVAILKHNNPCGVARGQSLVQAYERALECDPVSAFGSIVALNQEADAELAEAMRELFVEVVIAPGFAAGAREVFGRKKNLRLIAAPLYRMRGEALELRAIDGGFLAQRPDGEAEDAAGWRCVTRRQPEPEERRALEFAWKVTRYVKSNAIVLTNAEQTVGVGAGQMSRVDSCRLAIEKAVLPVAGSVAGSDAFFPFRDGLDVLADAGVRAVVQPGGSRRDDEVIAAADERGLAMLFTGRRHFRH